MPIGGGEERLPFTIKESPMTLKQDRPAPDGRKPRTKEELEEMLKSPQFRAEIMDGIVRAERGEPLIRVPLYEIRRKLRFDR